MLGGEIRKQRKTYQKEVLEISSVRPVYIFNMKNPFSYINALKIFFNLEKIRALEIKLF